MLIRIGVVLFSDRMIGLLGLVDALTTFIVTLIQTRRDVRGGGASETRQADLKPVMKRLK